MRKPIAPSAPTTTPPSKVDFNLQLIVRSLADPFLIVSDHCATARSGRAPCPSDSQPGAMLDEDGRLVLAEGPAHHIADLSQRAIGTHRLHAGGHRVLIPTAG